MRKQTAAFLAFWWANLRLGFGLAWGMVFSSPKRAFTTLLIALLASVLAYAFSGDAETANRLFVSAAYGFAAITVLAIAAGLGLSVTWAPFVAWRTVKAQLPAQNSLPAFDLKADTPLADAIHFAATGDWTKEPDINDAGYAKAISKAIDDFTQIASEGRLHVFHKAYRHGVWERLPATSWQTYRLDLTDVLSGEPVLRRRRDDARIDGGHDLTVCRAEWETRWEHYRSRLV